MKTCDVCGQPAASLVRITNYPTSADVDRFIDLCAEHLDDFYAGTVSRLYDRIASLSHVEAGEHERR
jgi:hypothetical protein